VGESEMKILHERPRYRWERNMKMIFKATVREDKNLIDLTEVRSKWWVPVKAVARIRVP
jgi:hypothetical protein